MLKYLVIIGVLIQISGAAVYAYKTVRGVTQPNRVSWFMWGLSPLIGVAASFSQGVRWALLPTFFAGFDPLVIFFLSFINKKGYWKLTIFDYGCGLLSMLALILWWITREANIAIFFAILSDLLAAVPTVVKAWRHPESETYIAYLLAIVSLLTTFAAVQYKSFAEIAFPIYLIFIDVVLVFSVVSGRWRKTNQIAPVK